MPSCVLKTCKNDSTGSNKKNSGITYHRFPRPDDDKREAWIRFVQKNRNENTWLPSEHTLICSEHFKDEDKYTTKGGRLYLKKCAVPYDGTNPNSGTSELMEPISEPVSDTESIFDTPQKIVLKRRLSKEMKARKILAVKLKKILRQNRYLKKKCESYKLMVMNYKSKLGLDVQMESYHIIIEK